MKGQFGKIFKDFQGFLRPWRAVGVLLLGTLPLILGSVSWAQGEMGSIGIMIDYDPPESGNVVVYSVTYRSPADRAKVKRGDRLLKVDGQEVTGKKLSEVGKLILGPVGTQVSLTLQRPGGGLREIPITRKKLSQKPAVALPPPSQIGQGVFLSSKEKELVKQKIRGLKTEEERKRMMQLLAALKNKQISKPKFMKAIKTQFP